MIETSIQLTNKSLSSCCLEAGLTRGVVIFSILPRKTNVLIPVNRYNRFVTHKVADVVVGEVEVGQVETGLQVPDLLHSVVLEEEALQL